VNTEMTYHWIVMSAIFQTEKMWFISRLTRGITDCII